MKRDSRDDTYGKVEDDDLDRDDSVTPQVGGDVPSSYFSRKSTTTRKEKYKTQALHKRDLKDKLRLQFVWILMMMI